MASIAAAALLSVGLLATQNASAAEPIKGSMVAYNTSLEKKKCKSKKKCAKGTRRDPATGVCQPK
jgi:hypothetical protein